jgi:hypothetical protein
MNSEFTRLTLQDGTRVEWLPEHVGKNSTEIMLTMKSLAEIEAFTTQWGIKDSIIILPPDPLSVQVAGSHYKNLPIQPIEYCEANRLGACESAIIKYITRWRTKGGLEDLNKIKHYVDLLIETEQKYHGWNTDSNTWPEKEQNNT